MMWRVVSNSTLGQRSKSLPKTFLAQASEVQPNPAAAQGFAFHQSLERAKTIETVLYHPRKVRECLESGGSPRFHQALARQGLTWYDILAINLPEHRWMWGDAREERLDWRMMCRVLESLRYEDRQHFVKTLGLPTIRKALIEQQGQKPVFVAEGLLALCKHFDPDDRGFLLNFQAWQEDLSCQAAIKLLRRLEHPEAEQWECLRLYWGEEADFLAIALEPSLILKALVCPDIDTYITLLQTPQLSDAQQRALIDLIGGLEGFQDLVKKLDTPFHLAHPTMMAYVHRPTELVLTCLPAAAQSYLEDKMRAQDKTSCRFW